MFNLKIKFKMEDKVQVSNSAQIAQNCLLVASLVAGDKVKYQAYYNGIIRHWDALVLDVDPLTLRVKFPDGYVLNTEVDETQWKFISKYAIEVKNEKEEVIGYRPVVERYPKEGGLVDQISDKLPQLKWKVFSTETLAKDFAVEFFKSLIHPL